jgi:hypothetical protein
MSKVRLLMMAIAIIGVVALAGFALVSGPVLVPGDDIIIKGGSLEIECGSKHGTDCLGTPVNVNGKMKYKHKKSGTLTRVVVSNSNGDVLFDSDKPPGGLDPKSEIRITYKTP